MNLIYLDIVIMLLIFTLFYIFVLRILLDWRKEAGDRLIYITKLIKELEKREKYNKLNKKIREI